MTMTTNPFDGLSRAVPTGPVTWMGEGPERPAGPAGPPATDKQVSFLHRLVEERYEGDDLEAVKRGIATLGKRSASKYIDRLINDVPKLKKPGTTTEDPPEGFHEVGGIVYKVQRAVHGSGKLYAKQLDADTGDWDYVGRRPLRDLSPDTLLTLERAKELGHLYGRCVRCGATLTNESSIEAGIGPVCAGKFA